jgi:Holliday junction DNA helicase RuvA
MISSLKGSIARIFGNHIEIDVGGVGYLVYVGNNFLKKHHEDENLKINIYMAVTENDINLYGFDSFEELDLFKMLITVSGVGPKTAAGILAEKGTLEIIKSIGDANVDFFKKIKGIGLKTAQRIIVDLKSKIGGLGELNLKDDLPLLEDDLVLSLQQLGFDRKEIENVTKKMPSEFVKLEERLEWCLLNLGR